MNKDEIIDFEQLYESMTKCQRGVNWKPSTKHFTLNGVQMCLDMEKKLKSGSWKNGKPHPILITHPKRREGLSIRFIDRVYQRSLNDNELYPSITKSFIFDNAACQRGKGTDFARRRIKEMLWNYFCNNGNTGFVLQIDIKGYYANMRHDVVKRRFKRHLEDDVWKMACDVLDTQYVGDVGYNPGSQMVQIAGISVLDELDHYIKEVLHEKYYIRYMDDLWILNSDKEKLVSDLKEIDDQLGIIGFKVHPNKTKIKKLENGFLFLGFNYHVTDTGKIIMSINGKNVKAEKRKLKRMADKVRKGEMAKEKVDECYKAWKAHIENGNSYKLLQRMDNFYKNLWRNDDDDSTQENNVPAAGEGNGNDAGHDRTSGCSD